MKIILCLLAAALLAAGCLTKSSEINHLSLGLSRAEAVKIMGTPASVTADANAEYLNYLLRESMNTPVPYEVKIVSGKVASYGRAGGAVGSRPVPVVMPMPMILPH